jgi:murein DD-endopeptidase MepM/ murein hydrolase activator NlpD
VALATFTGTAFGATGGAPTVAGEPPPPPSRAGGPAAGTPSAGTVTLLSGAASPRKSFYYGFRYPSLQFEISSTQPQNDLRIDVVDAAGMVVKSFYRNDVAPNTLIRIRWDGTTAEGRPARNGHYRFQILPQSSETPVAQPSKQAKRTRASTTPLGAHDFGESGARFGAARSGHTHQGQDVMAECGTPLVAARGGTVQYAGYQSAAGNYLVIDGKGTGLDFLYAHLAEPTALQVGDQVRTGQPVGLVGDTGNASACHLHFEIWLPPGWYQGGSPIDPLPFLTRWDRYS